MTVGELKEEEAKAESAPAPDATPRESASVLGLTLSAITPNLRDRFKIDPGTRGVLITQIAPDSPARGQGLSPGDVILEAASKKVSTPKEVVAAVDDAKAKKRKSVLLMVDGKLALHGPPAQVAASLQQRQASRAQSPSEAVA